MNLGPYFRLNQSDHRPLFQQIGEQISQAIRSRRLNPGDTLPTVRALSKQLGVSLETAQRAYHLLQADGWITSRPRHGTVISGSGNASPLPLPPVRAERHALFVSKLRAWMHVPGMIPVSGGTRSVDIDLLRMFEQYSADAVIHGTHSESLDAFGLIPLRSQMQSWLVRDGMFVPLEQLCIVSGTQQALSLCAHLTVEPGSVVFVPEMCYLAAKEVIRDRGARILTLPHSKNGVDLRPLEDTLQSKQRVSLVYALPNGHFPTGWSWTREQKERLLQLSEAYGFAIAEDDYYAGFYYGPSPPQSLRSLAPDTANLFYIRTLSNVTHPSFRLGLLACPPASVKPLERLKFLSDTNTSPILQHLMSAVWETGVIEQSIEQRRQDLKRARDAAIESCQKWLPIACEFTAPEAGLSFWVTTPGPFGIQAFESCIDQHVLVMPGDAFAVEDTRNGFQVNFNLVESDVLDEGIRRIGRVLRLEHGVR